MSFANAGSTKVQPDVFPPITSPVESTISGRGRNEVDDVRTDGAGRCEVDCGPRRRSDVLDGELVADLAPTAIDSDLDAAGAVGIARAGTSAAPVRSADSGRPRPYAAGVDRVATTARPATPTPMPATVVRRTLRCFTMPPGQTLSSGQNVRNGRASGSAVADETECRDQLTPHARAPPRHVGIDASRSKENCRRKRGNGSSSLDPSYRHHRLVRFRSASMASSAAWAAAVMLRVAPSALSSSKRAGPSVVLAQERASWSRSASSP